MPTSRGEAHLLCTWPLRRLLTADCLLLAASVDMIPCMMQKGYKAKGWLGLILGTRLYYNFHGAEVDDDAAFEKRMDAVVREIGDRPNANRGTTPILRGENQAECDSFVHRIFIA